MDEYEAMDVLRNIIIPTVKGTQWEEPIKIAADALMEKIQREEESCETCKVNTFKDELQELFQEGENEQN